MALQDHIGIEQRGIGNTILDHIPGIHGRRLKRAVIYLLAKREVEIVAVLQGLVSAQHECLDGLRLAVLVYVADGLFCLTVTELSYDPKRVGRPGGHGEAVLGVLDVPFVMMLEVVLVFKIELLNLPIGSWVEGNGDLIPNLDG